MDVFWAKVDRTAGDRFHPLLCHSVDVGAVVQALWEKSFPDASRERWRNCLGVADDEAAQRWLSFWASLHDLGKASPAFQGISQLHRVRLQRVGYPFPSLKPLHPLRHNAITRITLPTALNQASPPGTQLPPDSTRSLACALGGHHGQFPRAGKSSRSEVGAGLWEDARRDLVERLALLFSVDGLPRPLSLCAQDHAFFMAFAGLVSVADWIGSDESFFKYRPEVTEAQLATYHGEARVQAHAALSDLGWNAWSPPTFPIALSTLLQDRPARAMQQLVERLRSQLEGPSLVLIEAPMGEGKTEAAFYLADHWNQLLGQRGIYVAMPTQATANAMFHRFQVDYLRPRYPEHTPDLRLLHGQAMLAASREQPVQAGQVYEDGGETPEDAGALVTSDWFGYRKRGLLGPLAVGTVDQALMSVLQTRHGFVRLFGLADKTVILDEVHAFDTYTSTLMERLLAWLAALNCSVVLLSATLPAQRRQALLEAYGGDHTGVSEAPYPRVTIVQAGTVEAHAFTAHPQAPIMVRWMPSNVAQIVEQLRRLREEGGCVGWVCNTVGGAQQVYQELREAFADSSVEVELFHARYPFAERSHREEKAVRQYGKDKSQRPQASILVATQVIEQSLDLDFDLLITDLAPVDLVMQRSGRLHRHEETVRPRWLRERTVWLLQPDNSADDLPTFGNSEFIYGDYLLLRSWLALRERATICVPVDVEPLIEAVYGEGVPSAGLLAERLSLAQAKDQDRRRKLEDEARRCLIGKPTRDDVFTEFVSTDSDLADDDDPQMHQAFRAMTRYSEAPSFSVICLQQHGLTTGVETPEGLLDVDLARPPTETQLRALLDRSVSLSSRHATTYLLRQEAPAGWKRAALLRHCRAVVFDEAGSPVAADCPLRLDVELGVVIESPRREVP